MPVRSCFAIETHWIHQSLYLVSTQLEGLRWHSDNRKPPLAVAKLRGVKLKKNTFQYIK